MKGLSQEQKSELEKRIPRAVFLENIEEACRAGCDPVLAALDQEYNRYRLAEGQLVRSQQSIVNKIPEIEKTIQMVESLSKNAKMDVDFLISEGIYVKGRAKEPLEHVSLWLGANTIVQLTFPEAQQLLRTNLSNALSSREQISEELSYIKDQKTTTEVNVARVYNHSLTLKREQQIARSKAEE